MADKYPNEMSKDSLTAIWDHYYKESDDPPAPIKRKLKRVTKKDIIVRTLKNQKPGGEAVSLQELSRMTGLSPHDLSGHLTHLVNEGKIIRRGRGLFSLGITPTEGRSHRDELMSLVKSVARKGPHPLEDKVVITQEDHSESRRMMLDFLNDALLMCPEVELLIKCKKDDKGKGGQVSIELKAR